MRPSIPVLIALLVVLATATAPASAQPADAIRLYEEGVARLEAGNWSGAVGSLRTAMDLGVASTGLYYNLGVAYYRLDEIGEAIRFFERARRLDPDDRRILHNLEIARSRIPDRFSRLPVRFWTRGWQRLVSAVGPGGLFGFGLLLWLVPFGLVAWSVQRGRRPAWVTRIAWPAALVAVVFVAAGLAASIRSPYGRQAVVVDDVAPLHHSAGGDESDVSLYEGLTVDIVEQEGAWLLVRLPNGQTGWIEARSMAEV